MRVRMGMKVWVRVRVRRERVGMRTAHGRGAGAVKGGHAALGGRDQRLVALWEMLHLDLGLETGERDEHAAASSFAASRGMGRCGCGRWPRPPSAVFVSVPVALRLMWGAVMQGEQCLRPFF